MFNRYAIQAIKSGKQYTNTYVKANSIPETLKWNALSRVQKKVYNMVSAGADLIDADPTLDLFRAHLDDYRAQLEKYARILNGTDSETVSNGCIVTLVMGARRFRARDGELEADLKGGFGKWLQLCLYRDSLDPEVTREQAEAAFIEACKDPVKAKKSRSKKGKGVSTIIDLDLAARYAHGDREAIEEVGRILAALAAD